MDRRLALCTLAFGLLIGVGGCVEADVSADFEPLNSSNDVAEVASVEIAALDDPVRKAVTEGISDEVRYTPAVIEEGYDVEYNGSYYELSEEQSGSLVVERLTVSAEATNRSPEVQLNELSDVDREVVREVIESLDDDGSPYFGSVYEGEERNRSVLLDERSIVVGFEGSAYLFEGSDYESSVIDLYVYRSSIVANSSSEYADRLRSRHSFRMNSVPDGAEEVFEQAMENTYYGGESDGFAALRERFAGETAIARDDQQGVWLFEYEGQLYEAELRF